MGTNSVPITGTSAQLPSSVAAAIASVLPLCASDQRRMSWYEFDSQTVSRSKRAVTRPMVLSYSVTGGP